MEPDYNEVHSFKHVINKHFWKFFFGLLAMIAVGFFVAYGTYYYGSYKRFQEQTRKQEAQKAEAERLRKLYDLESH